MNYAFAREALQRCRGSVAESSAVWAESGMMTSGKLNHSAVMQLIKSFGLKGNSLCNSFDTFTAISLNYCHVGKQ